MTGYAVEFRIPTEHFMSSLTKVSSTTRVRHRAWIRRYARGVWRAAVDAGAYHLDRFIVFCQVGVGRFGVSFSPCERRVSGRFGVGRSCWLLVIALVIA
ncbi:hypothetical protein FOZ75_00005 [Bifidobacterium longum]|nr:hypothetical protein [Bifidobacterium longum]